MRTITGFLFDLMNGIRFAFKELGEAIDRALDVWGDE